MSQLTLSDASPPCMPATGAGAVRTSPREAAPDVSEADLAWQNKASFDPGAKQQQEWTSRLPIFRMANMQQYDPVKERSEDELQAMTFLDWLDYFLRLPAFAYKRRALFTDQQYLDVLYQCIPGNHATVSDQMKGRPVKEETWLYGQRGHDGRVLCCGWSPLFPAVVYSGAEDQTVRVWDTTQQKDREPPTAPPQSAVLKDGKDRARTHSREKDRRPGRASGDGRGRKAENGRSRLKSPSRQAAAAAHSPAAAVPVVTPLPSVDSSVLPAVSSRGIRPPQSPAMQPVPAVPSTIVLIEPDAPLLSIARLLRRLSATPLDHFSKFRFAITLVCRQSTVEVARAACRAACSMSGGSAIASIQQRDNELTARSWQGDEGRVKEVGHAAVRQPAPRTSFRPTAWWSILRHCHEALRRSSGRSSSSSRSEFSSEPQRQSGIASSASQPSRQLKLQQLKQQQHSSSSSSTGSNGNSPTRLPIPHCHPPPR